MADFTVTNQTKTALMELSTPIASLAAFGTCVQDLIDDPSQVGCTEYVSSGVTYDGVTKNRESYTGKVVYTDAGTGKTIGTITVKSPTASGLTGALAEIVANADLATDIGGIASHDTSDDSFSCQLKGHHGATDEIFYLTVNRDNLRLTSYTSDTILTAVEAWADAYPLA